MEKSWDWLALSYELTLRMQKQNRIKQNKRLKLKSKKQNKRLRLKS